MYYNPPKKHKPRTPDASPTLQLLYHIIELSERMSQYTLDGHLKAPRTYEQLKTELVRMKKANDKLFREFGYITGCQPNQFSISKLSRIVDDLKRSYKENKNTMPKKNAKKKKKMWKSMKRAVKNLSYSAARIITFCVKQIANKNLAEMQKATSSPMFCGWNKYYISKRSKNDKIVFEKHFENIEETNRAPYKQIRAYDDVSIPYHIRRKVIAKWNKMHYARRKDLLYVDIWNREKKYEPVRDELLQYLGPNIIFTLCWANPLCVFANSLCKKKTMDAKRDATNSYREAKEMSLKFREEQGRVKNASVIYWWQEDNFKIPWSCHPFDSNIVAALKGTLPKNFKRMWYCYKEHVQYLNNAAEKNPKGCTDAGENLYQWKLWKERLESDLRILLEGVKKVGSVDAFKDVGNRRWKVLKGCGREILVGDCREYVGYIGEEYEMRQEEIEREEEKWVEEMREEEIKRLEELQERMRGYGSD